MTLQSHLDVRIRFEPLELDEALRLSSILEDHPVPAASAVSAHEIQEHPSLWAVDAYYTEEPDPEFFRQLGELMEIELPGPVADFLEPRDWVRETLRALPGVSASRFWLHGRHDRANRRPGRLNLEVDASTAFGTGHHGTTHGCLMALDHLSRRGRPECVLDVGCGTGVLGLAAARMWRIRVVASDIDPQAMAVARQTARTNHLASFMRLVCAPGTRAEVIRGGAPYDLIIANILAKPLMGLARSLVAVSAPGGVLILSGLLCSQEQMVYGRYRALGCILEKRFREGPWSTLVLRKV